MNRPPWKRMVVTGFIVAMLALVAMIFITEPIRCYLGKPCVWREGWYS